ncbi:MAG: A24 family peptidase [Proteobacteria bacterium]|jgi:leader peptidase (prepilin peptidase)/N-methyltransferase|nr:A24 family peptidase [Pseudomonadota bacterium]MDA1299080.1 A24 family peptidase [Pseudomonadota bacterium]
MTEYLATLQAHYPVAIALIALMFGLIIGSFLNVVILRLPVMMDRALTAEAREILELPAEEPAGPFNLIVPDSHCPKCGTAIKPWQNIPVISYLWLRGRCGHCSNPIALRYPLIELTTGLMTATVIVVLGATPVGFAACLVTWVLIALACIDFDTMLLPDSITLPTLWLGLLVNFFDVFVHFEDAFMGAIAGYLSLWLVFHAFKLITGKDGMGYGDFKLLAMLGAWLGWQALPVIVILSSFAGVIIVGLLIVFGRDKSHPVPFGPYLAIAGWMALLWGETIMAWYLNLTVGVA